MKIMTFDERSNWISDIRKTTAEYDTILLEDLSEDELKKILGSLFSDLDKLMGFAIYFEVMATPSSELESYYKIFQKPGEAFEYDNEYYAFTSDEVLCLLGSLALARHEIVDKLQKFKNKLMLKKSGISIAP